MKPKTTEISVMPVKKYAAPKYPTRADAQYAPLLLKKLPSRWEKNAAVVAAVGMLGAMSLASCGENPDKGALTGEPAVVDFTTEQEINTDLSEYFEGPPLIPAGISGPPSFLSEQEALDIIITMAESEGLRFESGLPEYPDTANKKIKLYDPFNQVAVTYDWYYSTESTENYITSDGIAVGVFSSPDNWDDHENEEKQQIFNEWYANNISTEEVKSILEEEIRSQIRDFIEWLQGQGII